MENRFALENRTNIIGFGDDAQSIDTLRNYVLYHEFPYPVFKTEPCNFILQLLDNEGTPISTYFNEKEIYERLNRETKNVIEKSNNIQMKEFEWQRLDKPIERLFKSQTLFQYPTFMEKSDEHLFISDTFHNRVVKMRLDGHVECVFGDGIAGFKDGTSSDCKFHRPRGLFYDQQQKYIYVADTHNNTIRRIDPNENFVSTFLNTNLGNNTENYFRDDTTRIMLTEEYIEKQFILEREHEWLRSIPKPISIDYTVCSRAISKPVDLFLNYYENSLYIAEMGYKHIWKMDLENGIVQDVLPSMIYKYLRKDFFKYISQVFPTIEFDNRTQNRNLFPEFCFLKHMSSIRNNTPCFHYLVDSPLSICKSYSEGEYKFKQIKITPTNTTNLSAINDEMIESIVCNTIFSSTGIGFKNGSIIGEEKPEFNHPISIVKIENNLFISDAFNHSIRKLSATNGHVENLKLSNLNEFGVIASENHPHILPDGNLDENNKCGRLLRAEKMSFVSGSCLLKLYLKLPNNFKFLERITSNNIDIKFKLNGSFSFQHISYVQNQELFDPESFSISDDSDWKSIKRKNRAYTSLPELVELSNDNEMVLNIPFELVDQNLNTENLELDVTFTVFIGASTPNSTHTHPFTLSDHLNTVSYVPFNLQTCKLNNLLNEREIGELEASERKEVRHKVSQLLEWDLQETILSPFLREDDSILLRENEKCVSNESIICNDSSQVFVDCVTLRIPIQILTDSKMTNEKKRKHLIHHLAIPVSPSAPLFKQNHHKHQYIATSTNI